MSVPPYIPYTDAGFRDWAFNFANKMTLSPSTYMLTPAQAASIQLAVDEFITAYNNNIDPDTKSKTTVIVKDDKMEIAKALCRQYAMLIKDNAGITDEDKVSAGVRPINPNRTPIDVPMTSPLISILGNTPGSQTLRYSDTLTPDSRAKPFGASELQLYMAKTESEDAPLSQAQFYGKFTRNPIAVEFSEADDGLIATYYARWASARGEVGPWSLPISMRIAA